jgi:hypothetical protein
MRSATALLTTLVVAASAPAVAAAALPGRFVSTVDALRPRVEGLEVSVPKGDDPMLLRNRTGRQIVVLGYENEPYLRFGAAGGVWENLRSSTVYVNRDRYGRTPIPSFAKATAPPRWRRVAEGDAYSWHDHRIHWMDTIPPPVVRRAPDRPHRIFEWHVPARVGGRPVVIQGVLDYAARGTVVGSVGKASDDGPWLAVAAGIAALGVAGAAAVLLGRRRLRR